MESRHPPIASAPRAAPADARTEILRIRLPGWREFSHLLGLVVLAFGYSARAATVTVTGITEPIADVVLSASVPGIVSACKFKEGDFVKAGDALITLDNRIEELEVERRKAVLASRKSDRDALKTLAVKSSISVKKDELDKAETDLRIAETELEMAAEQLRRRAVITPCDGTIVELGRDVGEACQAYQPLLRVVDTRQCYFVSNVEAKLAGRLKNGQTVQLQIETSATPLNLPGKIVYLAPVVDPASGLQKVRVLFDNADGKINPGIAGRLVIE